MLILLLRCCDFSNEVVSLSSSSVMLFSLLWEHTEDWRWWSFSFLTSPFVLLLVLMAITSDTMNSVKPMMMRTTPKAANGARRKPCSIQSTRIATGITKTVPTLANRAEDKAIQMRSPALKSMSRKAFHSRRINISKGGHSNGSIPE